MRKSTTKMLSLILAFLMAFSTLNVPAMAAPIDGVENAYEEIAEVDEADVSVLNDEEIVLEDNEITEEASGEEIEEEPQEKTSDEELADVEIANEEDAKEETSEEEIIVAEEALGEEASDGIIVIPDAYVAAYPVSYKVSISEFGGEPYYPVGFLAVTDKHEVSYSGGDNIKKILVDGVEVPFDNVDGRQININENFYEDNYNYIAFEVMFNLIGSYEGTHKVTVQFTSGNPYYSTLDEYTIEKTITFADNSTYKPGVISGTTCLEYDSYSSLKTIFISTDSPIKSATMINFRGKEYPAELVPNGDEFLGVYEPAYGELKVSTPSGKSYASFRMSRGQYPAIWYTLDAPNAMEDVYYLKICTEDGKSYVLDDWKIAVRGTHVVSDGEYTSIPEKDIVAYPVSKKLQIFDEAYYPLYWGFVLPKDDCTYIVNEVKVDGITLKSDEYFSTEFLYRDSLYNSDDKVDEDYEVLKVNAGLYGEHSGTKEVKIRIHKLGENGIEKEYMLTKHIEFQNGTVGETAGPDIVSGTAYIDLNDVDAYKNIDIGSSSEVKEIYLVNSKRRVKIGFEYRYENEYSYSPEYKESLRIQAPSGSSGMFRMPRGQYPEYTYALDVSEAPNGHYTFEIVTADGRTTAIEDRDITVAGSEKGYLDFGSAYGILVPTAYIRAEGESYAYFILYNPEFTAKFNMSKYYPEIAIDGQRMNSWVTTSPTSGFLIYGINIDGYAEGEHTYSLTLRDEDEIIGSAKTSGTFVIEKEKVIETSTEYSFDSYSIIDKEIKTMYFSIPLDIRNDPIEKVEAIDVKDGSKYELKLMNKYYSAEWSRYYDELKVMYQGQEIEVPSPMTNMGRSIHRANITVKTGALPLGEYDLLVTQKSENALLCKNALKVTGDTPASISYPVDPDNPYYVSADSGYISVYVYCKNEQKLLENAPTFYLDKELQTVAAKVDEDSRRSPISYSTVVYQLARTASFTGKEPVTLYAYFGNEEGDSNGTFLSQYNAFVNENGKVVVPIDYVPSSVSKLSISTGTNKQYRIYLPASYKEQLEAVEYMVDLTAKVYMDHNKLSTVGISLYAKENSNATCDSDAYVIEVPTSSDFYNKISAGSSHQITIGIGNDSIVTRGTKGSISKLTNLTVAKGTWELFNAYDLSNSLKEKGLASGNAGTNIFDINQLEELSKYAELTLAVTTPQGVTTVKKVQFVSPLKDTVTYDLGEVSADNDNKSCVYKDETVVLNAPVANQHYEFKGWFLDSKFTKPVAKLKGTGGKDITVYAKWETANINVTFANGTAGSVKWDEPFEINGANTTPVGYNITHMYVDILDEEGNSLQPKERTAEEFIKVSDLYAGEGKVASVSITPDEATKTPVDYSIIYDLNGVRFYYEDETIDDKLYMPKEGELKTYTIETDGIDLPTPDKSYWPQGTRFVGWYTDSALKNGIEKIEKGMHGDLKVYAKWDMEAYTLRFDINAPYNAKITSTKEMPSPEKKVAEIFNLPANVYALASTESTSKKYVFRGWSTDKELNEYSEIYTDKAKVSFYGYDFNPEAGEKNEVILYAHYYVTNEDTFTIKYNYNIPGFVEISESLMAEVKKPEENKTDSYTYGTTKRLPTSLPEVYVPGYSFAGWENKATRKKITTISAKDAGDLELKAIWKPNTYKVAVNTNGGKGKVSTQTVAFNGTYNLEAISKLSKDGCAIDRIEATVGTDVIDVIVGDNVTTKSFVDIKKQDGGPGVVDLIKHSSGSTITYKIIWKPVDYNLTYNANGGECVSGTTYNYSTKTQEIATPVKEGYAFLGWYADPKFKTLLGKYNSKTGKTMLNAKVQGDKELYAKWAGNYTLILHSADGKKVKEVSGYKLETTKALPSNPFVAKSGYFFAGWATEKGSEAYIVYADKQKINLSESDVELKDERFVIDLYAKEMPKKTDAYDDSNQVIGKFDQTKFTISYRPTTDDLFSWDMNITGSMKDQTATSGKLTKTTKNKYKSSDYVFVGWTTDRIGKEPMYADGVEISNTVGQPYHFPECNIILYAVWKDRFDINFDVNADDAIAGKHDTYTYKYGCVVNEKTLKEISSPTRAGYDFAGWCTDAAGKKAFKSITKTTAGDFTLYAKWTPKKIAVNFVGGTGTTGKMKNQSVVYGKSVKLPKCAYKLKGSTFSGWNVNGTVMKEGQTYKPSVEDAENGFVTIEPVWNTNIYNIVFKNMDYMFDGYMPGVTLTDAYSTDAGYVFEPFTKMGYTCCGFYTDAKFTKPITEIPKGTTGNKTIYVKWKLLDENN